MLGLLGNSETANPTLAESPDLGLESPSKRCSRPNKLRRIGRMPRVRQPMGTAPIHDCGNELSRRRLHAMWIGPALSAAAAQTINSSYPPSYYGVTGSNSFRSSKRSSGSSGRHVRMLSRGLARGARVLDVGCGRASYSQHLPIAVSTFTVLKSARRLRRRRSAGRSVSHRARRGRLCGGVVRRGDHMARAGARPRSAGDIPGNPPDSEPGRATVYVAVPNYSSFQARWCTRPGSISICRDTFPLSARGAAPGAGRYRVYAASEHHFSLRQNPFGWVQTALNKSRRLPRNGLYTLLKSRPGAAPRTTRCRLGSRFVWPIGAECRSHAR